jgi:hypothetical protein
LQKPHNWNPFTRVRRGNWKGKNRWRCQSFQDTVRTLLERIAGRHGGAVRFIFVRGAVSDGSRESRSRRI